MTTAPTVLPSKQVLSFGSYELTTVWLKVNVLSSGVSSLAYGVILATKDKISSPFTAGVSVGLLRLKTIFVVAVWLGKRFVKFQVARPGVIEAVGIAET